MIPLRVGSVVRLVRVWDDPVPPSEQTVARVSSLHAHSIEVVFSDGLEVGFDFWPYVDVEVLAGGPDE